MLKNIAFVYMTEFDSLLNQLIAKINKVPNEVQRLVMNEIAQNTNILEDLNAEQLNKGIDSKGQKITPDYTPFTKAIKRAKGQPTDRVTLKDTGDFYSSIDYSANFSGVDYTATDSKTNDLTEKYGDDILGLTDESINDVIDFVEIDLAEKIEDFINS
jgi:hypothetical protein